MCNILYKIEIQMTMADNMTDELLSWVEQILQAHNCCVEEKDDYHDAPAREEVLPVREAPLLYRYNLPLRNGD